MKNENDAKMKLEEEKKLLESELSSIGKLDNKTGDWEAALEMQTAPESDENDLADREEDFEERSATIDVLQKRLRDIDHALQNIAKSTYGICEICGKDIEKNRLEANPAASRCKNCMDSSN